jgi:hypothetical protein
MTRPSPKTDAVFALRAEGLRPSEIAIRLGVSDNAVTGLIASRERTLRRSEAEGRTIVFSRDTLDQLEPIARKRGLHVNALCRRIVETALDDNMIDAILDDAP